MMLLATVLAALGAALAGERGPERRLQRACAPPGPGSPGVSWPDGKPADPRGRSWLTAPWFAGLLAATAVILVVGGLLGLVVGCAGGLTVARWIARLEPAAVRRRRTAELADLPLSLDLVVAAVDAGRPTTTTLALVADAVGGALGERLEAVAVRIEVGDPATVWRELADDPVLAPLARALARAARSGTSVHRSLLRSADDLRSSARAEALERARSVGVRTAAPLGACFLPAFLLVGVVPTVAATFAELGL
ncbi:type II secretion system F family protein [Mumia qirimensis]|uniref:type II secretion system F family protein n=1 Tax=Mumia qirimensis TaxID=3234852 RepID=UPI00351D9E78